MFPCFSFGTISFCFFRRKGSVVVVSLIAVSISVEANTLRPKRVTDISTESLFLRYSQLSQFHVLNVLNVEIKIVTTVIRKKLYKTIHKTYNSVLERMTFPNVLRFVAFFRRNCVNRNQTYWEPP